MVPVRLTTCFESKKKQQQQKKNKQTKKKKKKTNKKTKKNKPDIFSTDKNHMKENAMTSS